MKGKVWYVTITCKCFCDCSPTPGIPSHSMQQANGCPPLPHSPLSSVFRLKGGPCHCTDYENSLQSILLLLKRNLVVYAFERLHMKQFDVTTHNLCCNQLQLNLHHSHLVRTYFQCIRVKCLFLASLYIELTQNVDILNTGLFVGVNSRFAPSGFVWPVGDCATVHNKEKLNLFVVLYIFELLQKCLALVSGRMFFHL